ncbi:uncharacterized protein LOC115627661 [Scaptodrosophila lebanonensis]|uniref:Uncharacterized protein LOC115627661 n=1 Tax=Drosophila lebanonensis TaxID=7225 RepID=A0A6J2TVT3_DROLE|nr:uncharacterized protein LOC115627661 [Scaptodrosophila lebanonensis]
MNVSLIYASYAELTRIGLQDESANLFVAEALRYVIEQVLAQLSTTLVMTISSQDTGTAYWFEFVIEHLISSWSGMAVQLLYIKAERPVHVPGRKYCNFLLVDSFEGLRAADIAKDNASYDDSEYYFIFLQTRDAFISQELQLILDYCLQNYWLHCNVMIQTAQVEVLVYTYYPYTAQGCQMARPQLINRFDGKRMLNEPMFPDKLRNMYGCEVVVLTWHMPPYVELWWDDKRGKLQARGFEMVLVQHLADSMNFRVRLLNLTLMHVSSYQLRNGSHLGPIEMLRSQMANLSIGNFRKSARRNEMLTSPLSHYYSPLVATVEYGSYRISSLALLLFPFKLHVWLILLCAVALHLIIYMARRYDTFTGMHVIELLLGASIVRFPRAWLQRGIYAHWLYGSLPLRVVYQSLLFHLIRKQIFASVPDSFEKLLAENFIGITTSNTLQLLEEIPGVMRQYDSFVGMVTSWDQEVLDALHPAHKGGRKLFAITSLDVTNSYLRSNYHLGQYYILPQYVNVQQIGIYLPKHSYFYDKFDLVIRQLYNGGLTSTWRRWTFGERGPLKRQITNTSIGIGDLLGICMVMGTIYTLALLVFCIELLVHYAPMLRR